jgi:hypothetical protein
MRQMWMEDTPPYVNLKRISLDDKGVTTIFPDEFSRKRFKRLKLYNSTLDKLVQERGGSGMSVHYAITFHYCLSSNLFMLYLYLIVNVHAEEEAIKIVTNAHERLMSIQANLKVLRAHKQNIFHGELKMNFLGLGWYVGI